jgi:hypothetical protein
VCTHRFCVPQELLGTVSRWEIRRRQGWVVLTRCRVIWWELDSEHGDTHEFACANLIAMLIVALGGGLSVCGVFTHCCLNLSCYSLVLPCFILPRLVGFNTCSFLLLSSFILVVFGWLGWRFWVRVDGEG